MTTLVILLFIITFTILCVSVYNNNAWGGTIIVLACGIAYMLLESISLKSLLHSINENLGVIITVTLTYIVIGVLWSFFKWYLVVKEAKKDGRSIEYLRRKYDTENIVTWMMFFPISMLSFFLTDAVIKFYNLVEEQVNGVYEKILKNVYGEEKSSDSPKN